MARFKTGNYQEPPKDRQQALNRAAFLANRAAEHERRIKSMNDQNFNLEQKLQKLQETQSELKKALQEVTQKRDLCNSDVLKLKQEYQLTDAEIEALRTEILTSQIRALEARKDWADRDLQSIPGKDPNKDQN